MLASLCLSRRLPSHWQRFSDSTGSLFRSFPPHEVPNSVGGSFAATWGSDGFEKVLIRTRGAMDRRCVLRFIYLPTSSTVGRYLFIHGYHGKNHKIESESCISDLKEGN